MTANRGQGWKNLALVLAAAAAVRIAPAMFETQIGRDIAEYQAIARSLRAGGGFANPIKAYHQIKTPVAHYSGYDRAPLFPALLAAVEIALPERAASQAIGPILYLAALAFVFAAARRRFGERAALWSGLLLALAPGLVEISLLPLTEPLVLLLLALAIWAWWGKESAPLAGIACALAFLARPSAGLFMAAIGLAVAVKAREARAWRGLAMFAACALAGPALLLALNVANSAPPFQTPQNFLYRVIRFTHGQQYMHEGGIYPSCGALMADRGGEAIRQSAKNLIHYLEALADSVGGLGYLLPLALLAAAGAARRGRAAAWIAAIGAADLALYSATWATFDAIRFVSVFEFCAILAVAAGICAAFEPLEETTFAPWLRRAAPLALAGIAIMWGGQGAWRSYIAVREWQLGRPYSNFMEPVWDGADARAMKGELLLLKSETKLGADDVIASNEPWMTNAWTEAPAVMTPYDLRPEEWLPQLDEWKAKFVLIHGADWPPKYRPNMEALKAALAGAGWDRVASSGAVELWRRP